MIRARQGDDHMKAGTLDKALTWFASGWVILIVAVNLAAIAGLMLTAASFGAGVAKVRDIYSPFNIVNWLAELIALSPALAAYWWRERRRARS